MVRLWEPSRTGEASLQNLTLAVKIVRYCGLWRTDDDTRMYLLYTCVVATAFATSYVKFCVFCVTSARGVELLVESITMVFTLSPTVSCVVCVVARRRKLTEISERMREFFSFAHSGDEEWKYEAKRRSTAGKRKLTKLYAVVCLVPLVAYTFKPIVAYFVFGQKAGLPLRQLVLFEDSEGLAFVGEHMMQAVLNTISCCLVMSMDAFCFNVIASSSHQLELMCSMIQNVANPTRGHDKQGVPNTRDETAIEKTYQSLKLDVYDNCSRDIALLGNDHRNSAGQNVAPEGLSGVEKDLATLSQWHQETLKTAGKLAKLLSPVLLTHYLFSSLTICVLVYTFQKVGDKNQLMAVGSHLLLILSRIFMLGWISTELCSESLLVADAAYFSDWHDLSPNAKKTLMVMMARSQRPVVMRAGHLGALSLETCKKLLEAAYSYLNILNRMDTM